MLDQDIVDKLRERYPQIPPLLFHRSVERAKNNGDLFDILDTIPKEYPIVWDDVTSRWTYTNDLLQSRNFNLENNK